MGREAEPAIQRRQLLRVDALEVDWREPFREEADVTRVADSGRKLARFVVSASADENRGAARPIAPRLFRSSAVCAVTAPDASTGLQAGRTSSARRCRGGGS